tara:strand:- start:996 stop:1274 length:279 start_codon:yes stop_codon:yes gene_type:complete
MMTYIVVGICLLLLLVVIYIAAKPISMGIEARRNIKDNNDDKQEETSDIEYYDEKEMNKKSISDEIVKLNDLKIKGLITQEEYEKAKDRILN